MSNVLIGIIGVILFIGLALAGALFLGQRFQETRSNSVAAAQAQVAQQISHSVTLYAVNENGTVADGTDITSSNDLVTKGYLKSPPRDPAGLGTFQLRTQGSSRLVILGLQTKNGCDAYNRLANGPSYVMPSGVYDLTVRSACRSEGSGTAYTVYMVI